MHDVDVPRTRVRRRDARLLIAPFCDVYVSAHFDGSAPRARRELAQDLSGRGVSFISSDEEIVSRADHIRAVTLECSDGLMATLGVSSARVVRPRRDVPARIGLEFDFARPRPRLGARVRRLSDGYYAPRDRADATWLVRAVLGVDSAARDRRQTDRIRVPLEAAIVARLFSGERLSVEAALADVAPGGLGCLADPDCASGPIDRVELWWRDRLLLERAARAVFVEPATVRSQKRSRVRVQISGDLDPADWSLPLWVGPPEFGWIRLLDGKARANVVQTALLVRDEISVGQVCSTEARDAAMQLSYDAYVHDGIVTPDEIPRANWAGEFDHAAVVFLAHAKDVPVGTLSLVSPVDGRLPFSKYCPVASQPRLAGKVVEARRLAVSPTHRYDLNRRLGVALLLIAAGFRRCVVDGVDRIIVGVQPPQERFYRAMGFSPASDLFSHLRYGVPIRLMSIEVANAPAMDRLLRRLSR